MFNHDYVYMFCCFDRRIYITKAHLAASFIQFSLQILYLAGCLYAKCNYIRPERLGNDHVVRPVIEQSLVRFPIRALWPVLVQDSMHMSSLPVSPV